MWAASATAMRPRFSASGVHKRRVALGELVGLLVAREDRRVLQLGVGDPVLRTPFVGLCLHARVYASVKHAGTLECKRTRRTQSCSHPQQTVTPSLSWSPHSTCQTNRCSYRGIRVTFAFSCTASSVGHMPRTYLVPPPDIWSGEDGVHLEWEQIRALDPLR